MESRASGPTTPGHELDSPDDSYTRRRSQRPRGSTMTIPSGSPTIRRLTMPMRRLLYAAAALVFLAGAQLFILGEQTATYFAWTVAPPFTAAFLGAAYWAAVPVQGIAGRQMAWAAARAPLPGIWL